MFHVYLFFFCSGYVYSLTTKDKNNYSYGKFILNKLVALGVPYFTFSTITVLMKMLASSDVNTEADGLLYTLFIEPTAPYWYLYVLFLLFLIIPPFNRAKSSNRVCVYVSLAISVALRIIFATGILSSLNLPYFINSIMRCSIWFVLGMSASTLKIKFSKKYLPYGVALFVVFIALSIVTYCLNISNTMLTLVLEIIAVVSLVILFSCSNVKTSKIEKVLFKYNFPIYLMHTIFAAGIRILLVKLGITAWYIHIPVGLVATFVGPIITYYIMEKSKILEIFIYPTKLIKISH
jgi:fucose 4-O-acetylase-like acetyltransferase